MKRALVFLFLSACSQPVTVFKPVDVDIPVVVPCHVQAVAKPDFALEREVSHSSDVYAKTKAALIELDQRKAYESELESNCGTCR